MVWGALALPHGSTLRGLGWEGFTWGVCGWGPRRGGAEEGQLRAEAGQDPPPQPLVWVQRGGPWEGWTQPPGRAEAGRGVGALGAREGKGRRSASPTHRAAPAAAAPAKQAATWLCCGFSPSQLLIFRGPLLYFNACFYGNIYGAHAVRKTPLYSHSAAMLLKEMMLLVLEFHGLLSGRNENGLGRPQPPSREPSVCLHAEPRRNVSLAARKRGQELRKRSSWAPRDFLKEPHLGFPTGELAAAVPWAALYRPPLRGGEQT